MNAEAGFKFLGKYFTYKVGCSEKQGRLVTLRINPYNQLIAGIDENGFIEEYDIADVQVIKNSPGQKLLEKEIIKYVNKDINSFKFDLGEYYKETLVEILKKTDSVSFQDKIIEIMKNSEDSSSPEAVYHEILKTDLSDEEKEILCGIVSYKTHDINKAYELFSRRWLADKTNPEKCRDFLLIADEFDNDVLCFYLLKEFFRTNGKYISDRYYANLWWKCIFYCVKYNDFESLMTAEINDFNVRILLDSFVFVFHMYNMEHLAVGLTNQFVNGNNTRLQRNNEDLGNVQEAIEELTLLRNYLPENADGYYRRFELCLDRIISSYENNEEHDLPDERSGYVYEYVKSRNYGFIIGYDFKKIFFHWDFVPDNLRKRIIYNIYSNKEIDKQELIFVQYKEEAFNNKLQAIEMI